MLSTRDFFHSLILRRMRASLHIVGALPAAVFGAAVLLTSTQNCAVEAQEPNPATSQSSGGKSGPAASRGDMIAKCREHARQELNIDIAGITAKYEGKRTEGTYSIVGTAVRDGKETAFKCSFDSAGAEIIEFYYDGALGDDLPPDDEPSAPSAADGNAGSAAPLDPDGPSAAPDGRNDDDAAPGPEDRQEGPSEDGNGADLPD